VVGALYTYPYLRSDAAFLVFSYIFVVLLADGTLEKRKCCDPAGRGCKAGGRGRGWGRGAGQGGRAGGGAEGQGRGWDNGRRPGRGILINPGVTPTLLPSIYVCKCVHLSAEGPMMALTLSANVVLWPRNLLKILGFVYYM
jgi:hypothetical protein